jgi:Protein of unknown function (DUF3667)
MTRNPPAQQADRIIVPARMATAQGSRQQCANCGSDLHGAYCSVCGQRVALHSHSVLGLISEATEVLTHADSSLWRTLRPLLFQPGLLTQKYLEGRRVSFLSPFRLYILLSVVFFLIFAVTGPVATRSMPNKPTEAQANKSVEPSGEHSIGLPVGSSPAAPSELANPSQSQVASPINAASTVGPQNLANLCVSAVASMPGPDWIRRPFLNACLKSNADQTRELGRDFIHDLGRAMFVFLPVLALLLTYLYAGAGHHFVDHLLLLVHNQACVFLVTSIYLLMIHWISSRATTTVLTISVACYFAWYFYESLRRVYGERWLRTLAKFSALALGYVVCAVAMVFLTALYGAETL